MLRLPFLVLLFTFLSACSTRGHIAAPITDKSADKTLFVSSYYSGDEKRHLGEVVRLFENYGFVPTQDRDQAKYQLSFEIQGGAVVSVSISLSENHQVVLEAQSTNAGWGTVIARSTAISSRVNAALNKINSLLQQMFNSYGGIKKSDLAL